MLRFCEKKIVDQNGDLKLDIVGKVQLLDTGVWEKGRECHKYNGYGDGVIPQVVSVLSDTEDEVLCYAWQDAEANRELRMLRELQETIDAIQFQDIFPSVRKVVIYGCNELAYNFVKYLEILNIPVSVSGKFWEYMGYQGKATIEDDPSQMIILAEPVLEGKTGLLDKFARSVSPEFECIDQVYEANVLSGRIKDVEGGLEQLLEKLNGKDVVILENDERAQDAYDLLYKYGINILCFINRNIFGYEQYVPNILLDKPVSTVWDAMRSEKDIVFVDVYGEKSALGTANVDFFDYYGYKRNDRFFLLNEYTDIPNSNLIHVLKNKEVFLAGEWMLCNMLLEYLERVQNGDICVRYIEISEWNVSYSGNKILFVVDPWYGDTENCLMLSEFRERLKRIKDISYSKYFSHVGAFVLIDIYLNNNTVKNINRKLLPKGILLGAIPGVSGNVMMRGLLDGHPNIMQVMYNMQYYDLSNNLFWYCIILEWEKIGELKGLSNKCDVLLPNWKLFKEDIEKIKMLDDRPNSQEIFLAFHIFYMENIMHKKIDNMSQMIVYWEPHNFPRKEMPFFAKWLESGKIKGLILTLRRNNLVWYGSKYKWYLREKSRNFDYWAINAMPGEDVKNETRYHHWKEFVLRFEDIKLHPEMELSKLCDRVGIPWSDTMMHTTDNDWELIYEDNIVDFDIKPVFNQYEEYISEFDRFRISILSAPYQKKYGYVYEDCLQFSRNELQNMFLKKFRFQKSLQFDKDANRIKYYFHVYDTLRKQLWETRKHAVLNDIVPQFNMIEIGRTNEEERKRKKREEDIKWHEEINRLTAFIRSHNKVVLYGIGKDCTGLWEQLDSADKEKILFCDSKALKSECVYQGKKVLTPQELCSAYSDYAILITSSRFSFEIQKELKNMGVSLDRIVCNKIQLWRDYE